MQVDKNDLATISVYNVLSTKDSLDNEDMFHLANTAGTVRKAQTSLHSTSEKAIFGIGPHV